MADLSNTPLQQSLYRYIWAHTARMQIGLLLLSVISFGFLYISLELPKRIVNDAIKATSFPKEWHGFSLNQTDTLWLLCGAFLITVLCSGALKYIINVGRGVVAERTVAHLRRDFFAVLTQQQHPRQGEAAGEYIPSLTSEVDPIGGFAGDAFVLPLFQGGTLLTILTFMALQNPLLALAATLLFPVQILVIPRLQRRVNALARLRIQEIRSLAAATTDTLHALPLSHTEREEKQQRFAATVDSIYTVRFRLYRIKFFIKFFNNFIAQVTPFFFYAYGGYLVIEGELTFGALLAALTAHKDVIAPWKELLDYYQDRENARVKYSLVREHYAKLS